MRFFGCHFFFYFQKFQFVISLSCGFHCFWWEVSCNCYWDSLLFDESFSLTDFKIFFLFSVFSILTLMYIGVNLSAFILLWGCLALWMCRLMFFINLGSFQLLFLGIYLCVFLLFSSSGTSIMRMLVHFMVSSISLRFCSFFFPFPSLCSSECITCNNLS